MRRTLTVLVATAALLAPAAAASASTVSDAPRQKSNASCNNGKGGNLSKNGAVDNGKGSGDRSDCQAGTSRPDPVQEG